MSLMNYRACNILLRITY